MKNKFIILIAMGLCVNIVEADGPSCPSGWTKTGPFPIVSDGTAYISSHPVPNSDYIAEYIAPCGPLGQQVKTCFQDWHEIEVRLGNVDAYFCDCPGKESILLTKYTYVRSEYSNVPVGAPYCGPCGGVLV